VDFKGGEEIKKKGHKKGVTSRKKRYPTGKGGLRGDKRKKLRGSRGQGPEKM